MPEEKPEFELIRLRKEQNKARHDEVFGGLSPAERSEYNGKAERIHELENLQAHQPYRSGRDSGQRYSVFVSDHPAF